MSDDAHPWWASAAGTDPSLDDADPVEAVRAARRREQAGAGADGGTAGARVGDDPGRDAGRDPDRDADEDRTRAHDPDVCGVCPICLGLRALGESRPELLAHLTEAGRHLAAALRTLVDPPEDHAPDLERIDLEPTTPTDDADEDRT